MPAAWSNGGADSNNAPSSPVGGRLRLLQVAPRYLPFVGGTEIHTAEVSTRLAALGHDVTVVTADAAPGEVVEEVRDGVRIVRHPSITGSRDYYFSPSLYSMVSQWQGDLVHVQGYHTFLAPVAMLAAIRGDHPFVLTFHSGGHSSQLRRRLRPLQRSLLRPLLGRSRGLIGVSDFETRLFSQRLRLPEVPFATIPNGSSLTVETHATMVEGHRPHGVRICSIGRLERYKGHHRAIGAMPHLRKLLPGAVLQIIGSGTYERTLRELASNAGAANCVEFLSIPAERRVEMAAAIRAADLVVLLSDYESQGIAVLEALSLERPVLVSDAAALADLARQGCVLAAPLWAEGRALADMMVQAMRTGGRVDTSELLGWDEITTRLLDFYRVELEDVPCAS